MPDASQLRSGRSAGSRLVAVAIGALFLLTGCGASEDVDDGVTEPSTDGPRVADARFDGRFEISEVVADQAPFALSQQPAIEIETEFGGLTVLPGCNTYFGSFTLTEDGEASFTITGGSGQDCGPLAEQEATVLAALDAVDQWDEVEAGFRFSGGGSTVVITGPAG
ncbi:MAG: META domain-containing protein [Actinomycetota bacterium]